LFAIAERRSNSGEDTEDEDYACEGGWKSADVRNAPRGQADESVLKAGYLWKKGERRKVLLFLMRLAELIADAFFDHRHGRSGGLSFDRLTLRTTRVQRNISYSVYSNYQTFTRVHKST